MKISIYYFIFINSLITFGLTDLDPDNVWLDNRFQNDFKVDIVFSDICACEE